MPIKIAMAKGRLAHRKFHNSRATGIQLKRWELEDCDRGRRWFTSFKGGYSGWRRAWEKVKGSAFAERHLTSFPGSICSLPIRHPRIRLESC